MLKLRLLHPLLWGLILVLEEVASQQNRCGLVPTEIFLKKGERKQLIFWTDQNYENITTTLPLEGSTEPNNGVDSFLEAVNGGLPIPSTSSNDTESYPEFIGQPEVSSTEAPPQEESTTEQGTPVTTTFDSLTTLNTEESLETTTFPFESTTMEITETTTDSPIITTEDTVIQAFNEPNVTTEKISILQPSAVVTQPPDLEGEVVQVLIASTIKMEDLTTTMEPIETTTILATTTEIRNEETTTEELEEESTQAVEDTTNKLEVVGELEVEDDLSMEIAELQDEIFHDDTETEVDTSTPDNETASHSSMPTSTLANAETSLGTEAVETTTGAITTQEPNESTSFETTTLSDSETEASISGDYLGETEVPSEDIDDLILDDDTDEEEETEQTVSTSIDTTISEETEIATPSISVEQASETEAPGNEVNETVMEDDSVEGAKEEKIDANLIIDETTTTSQSEIEPTTTEAASPDQSQDKESPTLTIDDIKNEEEAIETTTIGDLTTTQTATLIVDNDAVIEVNQQESPNGTDAPAEEFEDIILDDDTDYYSEAQSETTTSNGIESTTHSILIPQVDVSDTSNDEETINVDTTTIQPTTSEESSTTIEVHEEDQFGEVEEQVEEIVDIILDDDEENEDNTETTTNSEIESTTEAVVTTGQPDTAEELTSDEVANEGTVEELSTESVIDNETDLEESENVNTGFPSETNLEASEAPTASFEDVILDDDSNDNIDEPETTTQDAGLSIVTANTPASSTSEESQTNESTITEKPSDEEQGSPLVLSSTDEPTFTTNGESSTTLFEETTKAHSQSADQDVIAVESTETSNSQMETTAVPTQIVPESTTEEHVTTPTENVPETTENVAILVDDDHDYTDSEIQFDDPEETEEVDHVVAEEVATEAIFGTMKDQKLATELSTTPEDASTTEVEGVETTTLGTSDTGNNLENLEEAPELQIVKIPDENAFNTNNPEEFQITEEGLGAVLANIISKIQEEAFGSGENVASVQSETNFTIEIQETTRNKTQEVEILLQNGEKVADNASPITSSPEIVLLEESTEPISITRDISDDILYDDESEDIEKTMVFIVPDNENSLSPSVLTVPVPDVITQNLTLASELGANLPAEAQPQIVSQKTVIFQETTTGSPLDAPFFAPIELEVIEFKDTTTGSPLDDPQEAKEEQPTPIFAAVESEDIEEPFEFSQTTTGSPLDIQPQQDREDPPLNFAAIEQEEQKIEYADTTTGSSNDIPIFAPIEVDPIPFEFTETTTGIPFVAKSSNGSVLDIDQSTKVDGPLDLENIQYYDDPEDYQSGFSEDTKTSLSQSKLGTAQRLDLVLNKPSEDLERMTRKEDEDAIVDAQGLQDLSPYHPKINTSDPGSLLTTILDGILSSKPRPPPQAPQLNHKRTTVKPLPIIVTEEAPLPPTTTDDGFPVSNLLNGIYRLVSSYITPRPTVEPLVTEMDFTPPDSTTSKSVLLPINVHNTRREELNEKVDNQYSKTDPFVQLQAPDLRKDGEIGEQQMLFPVPIPKESVSTFSPFNSPALKIQKPPQIQGPRNKEELAGPLPISAPVGDVPNSQEIFYPGNYLRGGSTSQKKTKSSSNPQIGPSSAPYLSLVDNQRNRDPVSIPLPDLLGESENNYRRDSRPPPIEDNNGYDAIGSIRRGEESFYRFINAQPLPIQRGILDPANRDQRSKRQLDEASPLEDETSSSNSSEPINCNWSIKTEQGLYLLVTFHNLSAPFTVDCQGAYIEVERENNGFEARWCGNRVTQGGSRPHVIFAKNEVRISVFDDGSLGKELPTGFSADVEVIDLYDGEQYSNLSKTNAYSNVRLLNG